MAAASPTLSLIATALVVAAPKAAVAQIKTPLGYLIPEIRALSDYRYNGVSNSDRQPTVQAGVYLWRPDGLYAGIDASRVRFNDGRGTDVEVDLYGGRNLDFGKTRLTLEGMVVTFPDQRPMGQPTYDFVQATLKARHEFGRLALGATATWTPQGSYHAGQVWRGTAEAAYQLSPWVSLGGKVGRLDSERGQDRTYWDAGATLKRGNLSFDLRYFATNLSRRQCFFTDRCAPGVAGKLTYTFLPQPPK